MDWEPVESRARRPRSRRKKCAGEMTRRGLQAGIRPPYLDNPTALWHATLDGLETAGTGWIVSLQERALGTEQMEELRWWGSGWKSATIRTLANLG